MKKTIVINFIICMLLITNCFSIVNASIKVEDIYSSDFYEDSFTNEDEWVCTGDVTVIEDQGILSLSPSISEYQWGAAEHNGLINPQGKIYKVQVKCNGQNGKGENFNSETIVKITVDGWDNEKEIVKITSVGGYNISRIWDVPTGLQGSKLGIRIGMGENEPFIHFMTWIKVTYYFEENEDPIADAGGPYVGEVNNPIDFDGSGSYDPDGTIIRYDWKWTENSNWNNDIGPTPTHTYSSPETYNVKLRVHDNNGAETTDTTQVTVTQSNEDLIADAGGKYEGYNDVEIDFQGFASGGTGDYSWYWEFGDGDISIEKNPTHIYSDPGDYDITLKVTDSDGTQDTDTTQAYIDDKLSAIPDWGIFLLDAAGLIDTIEEYWYGDHFEVTIPFSPMDISKLQPINGSPDKDVDFPDANGDADGGEEFNGEYEFVMDFSADIVIKIYPGDISRSSIELENGECNADLSAHVEWSGGIEAGVNTGLEADFEYDGEWQWDLMAYIDGTVTFPVVKVQGAIWIIPVYANVNLGFNAGVDFYFGSPARWSDNEDFFEDVYKRTEGDFGIEAELKLGVGISDIIGAGIYTKIGGSWNFEHNPDADNSLFHYFEAYFKLGGYAELFGFGTGYWEWYSTSWNSNDTLSDPGVPDEGWNFMERNYNTPDWNNEYEENGILINDAFPAAHPSIDRNNNDEKIIVWAEDDLAEQGGINLGEGIDLWYTKYNGNNWDGKHRIMDDNKVQSNPSVQLFNDGSAICVYNYASERNNEDVEEMFKKTGIAYSKYDGNSWIEHGIIQNHNDDEGMHLMPVVRSYADNKAVAAWIYDEDANISTINDRELRASFWDGTSWSSPRDILNINYKNIVSAPVGLAVSDNGRAVAVYIVDIDGTLATRSDQHVYYTMFSPPETFDPDETIAVYEHGKNAYPSVAFIDDNDHPSVMWTHEEEGSLSATVYYQPNTNTFADPETVITGINSTSSAFLTGSESNTFGPEIPIIGWIEDKSICYKRRANDDSDPDPWEDNKNILYTSSEDVTQTSWDFEATGSSISVVFVGKEDIAETSGCKLISIGADALLTPRIQNNIDGPSELFINDNGEFSVTATDPSPEGELKYRFDWGDETNTGWIGPYPTGQEVKESHSWDETGTYTVSVKAKNSYKESIESTISITVKPRIPKLYCDADSISLEGKKPGSVTDIQIKIKNDGDPLSILNWEIIDNTGDCGTWQFEPKNGNNLKPEDGEVTINIKCTMPLTPENHCNGYLEIISNDEDSPYEIPVEIETRALIADLTVNGEIVIDGKVEPGSKIEGSFTVENIGEPDSKLNWYIDSKPSFDNWECNPSYGYDLTPEDGKVTVNVSFNAPNKRGKEFDEYIVLVNEGNTSDKEKVRVSFKTSKSKSKSSQKSSDIVFDGSIALKILEIINQYKKHGDTFNIIKEIQEFLIFYFKNLRIPAS